MRSHSWYNNTVQGEDVGGGWGRSCLPSFCCMHLRHFYFCYYVVCLNIKLGSLDDCPGLISYSLSESHTAWPSATSKSGRKVVQGTCQQPTLFIHGSLSACEANPPSNITAGSLAKSMSDWTVYCENHRSDMLNSKKRESDPNSWHDTFGFVLIIHYRNLKAIP